jgi:carbonic anhydrase
MTEADRTAEFARILAENRRYTDAFDRSALTAAPLSKLVIVACMDARLDVEETLGLRTGDAHIIRNAGGLVTDDVIRSLIISMELLGTEEIVLIEHTRCGLHDIDEDALKARVAEHADDGPDAIDVAFGGFSDLEENVRRQVAILREHPYLLRVPIHGLIFDVSNGRLTEVA